MIFDAVIFCGGQIDDYSYVKEFFDASVDPLKTKIICADFGVYHAQKLKLKIDLIAGDGDSWEDGYQSAVSYVICPKEKDYTDTAFCIEKAIEWGADNILLLGATGGRLDHEFSHYCLMLNAKKRGVNIVVADKQNLIYMKDKPFSVDKTEVDKLGYKYISFFPFGGDAENLCINGFKYSIDRTVCCSEAITLSNEFMPCGKVGEISFTKGVILVIYSKDLK